MLVGKPRYHSIDGDQIIAEYDGSGALQANYIFGPGIDEPMKGLSPQGTVPEWYYHYDGLGSVISLTDSSGSSLESYEYDVFGSPSTISTLGNRFMFTGREYEEEIWLYYYRARYYSPTIGRFLERDIWLTPLTEPASLVNRYLYCDNNAVNFVDPFGLDKQKSDLEEILDYWKLIGEAFKTGNWTLFKNIKWLDKAIQRMDKFKIVTNPLKHQELMKKLNKPSAFTDLELPYLLEEGFINKGSKMVRP